MCIFWWMERVKEDMTCSINARNTIFCTSSSSIPSFINATGAIDISKSCINKKVNYSKWFKIYILLYKTFVSLALTKNRLFHIIHNIYAIIYIYKRIFWCEISLPNISHHMLQAECKHLQTLYRDHTAQM